jgi:hypothetical protein
LERRTLWKGLQATWIEKKREEERRREKKREEERRREKKREEE